MDSYLWYLRGVVEKGLGLKGTDAFVESILLDSWIWAAWMELSNLITNLEEVCYFI